MLLLVAALALAARGAEILTEEDAHLMKVLQPAARSSSQEWMEVHTQYVAEVDRLKKVCGAEGLLPRRGGTHVASPRRAGLKATPPLQAGIRPDLVVYGDSITESYLATSVGQVRPDYEPNKQHWDAVIKTRHPNAHIFSISGAHTFLCACRGAAVVWPALLTGGAALPPCLQATRRCTCCGGCKTGRAQTGWAPRSWRSSSAQTTSCTWHSWT